MITTSDVNNISIIRTRKCSKTFPRVPETKYRGCNNMLIVMFVSRGHSRSIEQQQLGFAYKHLIGLLGYKWTQMCFPACTYDVLG